METNINESAMQIPPECATNIATANSGFNPMTLWRNDFREAPLIKHYPVCADIKTAMDLKRCVAFDHTAAEYMNNERSNSNFIRSNCLPMDIDNDHTDNSMCWVTLEKLLTDFNGLEFYVATSRNHMKDKGAKFARPKFHVYFPIGEKTNATEYAAMKATLCGRFAYFDKGAKDAARFFFGNPQAEVWHVCDSQIVEYVK
jgi:hypothetical protein